MPKNVIELDSHRKNPHLSGEALCLECGNEWEAVAPIGTTLLDCPECDRYTGVFKHSAEPEMAWACNCGNQLFFITPNGCMCRKCGDYQAGYE